MTSKTTTSAERSARRSRVWKLRTQDGLSQTAIAEIVNVSQMTVSRDLDHVAEQVAADLVIVARREKIVQAHQLQTVVREAWKAWQDSKQPYREFKREVITEQQEIQVKDDQGVMQAEKRLVPVGEKVQTKTVERVGNVTYLREALAAMRDLRDLLGLEEPKEITFNWRRELENQGFDPSQVFESMVQTAFELLDDGEAGEDEDGEGESDSD
jgi:predicted transcriptional regulator